MKKIIVAFMLLTMFNCTKNDNEIIQEATLLGRWNIVGFERNVLYEFTQNKKYTIYSSNGTFPKLSELLTQNPSMQGLDWWYDGDKVTVDLNFGHFSTLKPTFKCNNNVIEWLNTSGETNGVYYREGYNYTSCN